MFLIDIAAFKLSGGFANNPNSEEIMKRFQKIPIILILKSSRMTKNYICSKDFPEIIDFSRKLKESRTNINVSKQLKNSSDSKKIMYYKDFSRKLSEKSLMFLAFQETSP